MGEAQHYADLVILQKAGEISQLEIQIPFQFVESGKPIFKYICDFRYLDRDGITQIVDYKGYDTAIGKLKRKLIEARFGFKIKVV
jgi:hypothetical protein